MWSPRWRRTVPALEACPVSRLRPNPVSGQHCKGTEFKFCSRVEPHGLGWMPADPCAFVVGSHCNTGPIAAEAAPTKTLPGDRISILSPDCPRFRAVVSGRCLAGGSCSLLHVCGGFVIDMRQEAGELGIVRDDECKVAPLLVCKCCHDKVAAGQLYFQ